MDGTTKVWGGGVMSFEEYFIENLSDIIAELCQYQKCDNCSIGELSKQHGWGRCPLHDMSIEDMLTSEMDVEEAESLE